jgi:hypothetical protein
MVPQWLLKVFHTIQKFGRASFLNGWSYGIKNDGVFNGMISVINFIKVYQLVQKYIGEQIQTGRWSHKPAVFSFNNESRLKKQSAETRRQCPPYLVYFISLRPDMFSVSDLHSPWQTKFHAHVTQEVKWCELWSAGLWCHTVLLGLQVYTASQVAENLKYHYSFMYQYSSNT